MFKNLFKKPKLDVYAPISGKLKDITEVPDPVFNQKMVGDGVAIEPANGEIVSPIDGEIVQIPDSKHAIGLKDKNGIEILIHIGLETVSLNGHGFTSKVVEGDTVKVGDPLMVMDLSFVQEHAEGTITPVLIPDSNKHGYEIKKEDIHEVNAGKTKIFSIF